MRVKALQINIISLLHTLLVNEILMVVNEKLVKTIQNLLKGPWACIIEKYNIWIWSKQTEP